MVPPIRTNDSWTWKGPSLGGRDTKRGCVKVKEGDGQRKEAKVLILR